MRIDEIVERAGLDAVRAPVPHRESAPDRLTVRCQNAVPLAEQA
jgi:hypothetical protein